MFLSSQGEGIFCSPESGLLAQQIASANMILDALRAGGVNGYRFHGWHVEQGSIEYIAFDIKSGIQFKAKGLPGKPVLQILLDAEFKHCDIFAGRLQRNNFSGRRIGCAIQIDKLTETINREFAVAGGCHVR